MAERPVGRPACGRVVGEPGVLPRLWLEPLAFGRGTLPNRIVPGPMEGVTGGAFCSVMAGRGLVRCWITPFLRVSTDVPRRARLQARFRPFLDLDLPVVAQVMGTDAGKLAETAARLVALGVAGVDLNCACPSPAVVASGAGGMRLRAPAWIRDALLALRQAVGRDGGVSVKLRSGVDDPAEMEQVLPLVAAAEPDFVVLHYRTVREGYRVVATGWERFRRARELLPRQVLLASGDIDSVAAAATVRSVAAVDGVAPARGLLRNPWLLTDIESACRGDGDRPPRGQAEWLGLLGEFARVAWRHGQSHHGFVLEIAGHRLGRDSGLFRSLLGCRDLTQVCEWVRCRLAEAQNT